MRNKEEITKEQFLKAKEVVDFYHDQEKEKQVAKQLACKHKRTKEEVSEWHRNGQPDRWETFCLDCGFILSS